MTITSAVPAWRIEVEDEFDDALARLGVEVACRLVGEEERGPVDERPRQRHALLFAAGKLRGIMPLAVFEAHLPQEVRRLPGQHGRRFPRATPAQFGGDHHVFQRGQRRHELEVLEHEARVLVADPRAGVLVQSFQRQPASLHRAARGAVQPGAESQQRRLAAARRPDDGAGRPGRQRKTDPLQHRQFTVAAAVGFGQLLDFEDGRGRVPWFGQAGRRNVTASRFSAGRYFTNRPL